MEREKPLATAINLTMILLLIGASAVLAYGQRGSDECAQLLAKYKRLDAKARESDADLRVLEAKDDVRLKMRELGCPDPRSRSDQSNDRPTHVPETEDSAAYTESPESRHMNWRGFLEKMQPPDSEAPGTCGDLSGRWQITTSEGTQTWEIWHTELAPRLYGGRRASGADHAKMLAALLDGNMLKLQFDSYNEQEEVHGGTYTCKLNAGCRASLSECNLTYDRNRKGSFDATFKWLGPRPRN